MWLKILVVILTCCKLSGADCLDCYPDKQAIDSFINSLTGKVLKPGDSQYQNASKMENKIYTKQPGMIIMAESVQDVQKSVLFAKEHDLQVTVHSTGHDFIGRSTADGSLMINLSSMKKIAINLYSTRHDAGEVTVGTGNTWIQIYEAVQEVNRVVVGGISKTVSPGGFTLGGGHSPISRKFGLAVDQVLQMKVVLADGCIVDCTPDGSTLYHLDGSVEYTKDTDLFWALRGGGGGTFGIVVEFTYKLHYQPEQLVIITISAPIIQSDSTLESSKIFLKSLHMLMKTLPDEYGAYLLFNNIKRKPQNTNQTGTFMLFLVKFGPWDSETKILDPFQECIECYGCKVHFENKTSFYDYVKDAFEFTLPRFYLLGALLEPEKMDDCFTEDIVGELMVLSKKSVIASCAGPIMGGKAKTFSDASAPIQPGFRSGIAMLCVLGMIDPSRDEEITVQGEAFSNLLLGYGNGAYLNEAAYDLDNWQELFWGHHYQRLLEIKRKWDPSNFFSCHHCVGSENQTKRKSINVCDE